MRMYNWEDTDDYYGWASSVPMKLFMVRNKKTGLWYKYSRQGANWVQHYRASIWQTFSEARDIVETLEVVDETGGTKDSEGVEIVEFKLNENDGDVE